MTAAFTTTETIDAAPERVWRVLTDWSQAPRWMPGVTAAAGPADPTPGAELALTARGKQRISTVHSIDSGATLTLRSVQGGVTADYHYLLRPAQAGTEVLLTAEVATRGMMTLLGPIIRRAIRGADAGQLTRLKSLVEDRATAG